MLLRKMGIVCFAALSFAPVLSADNVKSQPVSQKEYTPIDEADVVKIKMGMVHAELEFRNLLHNYIKDEEKIEMLNNQFAFISQMYSNALSFVSAAGANEPIQEKVAFISINDAFMKEDFVKSLQRIKAAFSQTLPEIRSKVNLRCDVVLASYEQMLDQIRNEVQNAQAQS